MTQKPDLVVVGFSGELKLLKLQARSLRLFAPDAFNKIHYVINEENTQPFVRYYENEIRPELGSLADRACLLEGRLVAGMPLRRMDWRSQQSLKLLASRHVEAENFLILDSKNHFVRTVIAETFVTPGGCLYTHRYEFNESFRPKFDNACKYFDVDHVPDDLLAMPTATPFMMSTRVARDLVADVEAREGVPFHGFFTSTKDFTEFYFYFAYLLSKPCLLDQLYETRERPQVTLFRSVATEPDKVQSLLKVLDREAVYLFGVHREVLKAANPDIAAMIRETWRRFGLVEDEQEAVYFLTPDRVPARRKWWQFWR